MTWQTWVGPVFVGLLCAIVGGFSYARGKRFGKLECAQEQHRLPGKCIVCGSTEPGAWHCANCEWKVGT